jgi:hypothetical protein
VAQLRCALSASANPTAAPRGHVRLERQPRQPSSRYQTYPMLYADIRKQSDKFRDARERPRPTLTRGLDPWRPRYGASFVASLLRPGSSAGLRRTSYGHETSARRPSGLGRSFGLPGQGPSGADEWADRALRMS